MDLYKRLDDVILAKQLANLIYPPIRLDQGKAFQPPPRHVPIERETLAFV
jgi:hypothetical protein